MSCIRCGELTPHDGLLQEGELAPTRLGSLLQLDEVLPIDPQYARLAIVFFFGEFHSVLVMLALDSKVRALGGPELQIAVVIAMLSFSAAFLLTAATRPRSSRERMYAQDSLPSCLKAPVQRAEVLSKRVASKKSLMRTR